MSKISMVSPDYVHRTPAFHAGNRGSNPLGDANKEIKHLGHNLSAFFIAWGAMVIMVGEFALNLRLSERKV